MPARKIETSPEEVLTRERTYIRERLNDASVADFSLARSRVEPGVTTELHRLSVDEWYAVVSGTGLMSVGSEPPFPVAAGDVVEIPAGTPQQITNTGETDLEFDCICLPRFTTSSYEPLED